MKAWLRARATATVIALVVTALLASCQVPPPKAGPAPGPVAPPVSGRLFRILPAESEVRVLVFRSGSLAKLGHNHVIASHDLNGTVTLPDDPTQARFEIAMPVDSLVVDERETRAQEGPEFATQMSDAARLGTHKNMLKPEILDGDHYPAVMVRSTHITRAGDGYAVVFEVELRGLKHQLEAPVQVLVDAGQLRASGELTFKQSELGITPFTVALGALAVKDEVRLKFDIHTALSER